MKLPTLYRRRFIPDETVELKNDEIIHLSEDLIITKWEVLKPREDFTRGASCYYLDKGFKISKFYNQSDLVYIYCDIIEYSYNKSNNSYIFNDLLLDVIIYNDGFVKVMDVGEIADALDQNLISVEQAKKALNLLNDLLEIIYKGNLDILTKVLDYYSL